MPFDKEQLQQMREVMREVATDVATNIVVKEIAASEKRIISSVTDLVGEMVEAHINPQFQELRDEIALVKRGRWRMIF